MKDIVERLREPMNVLQFDDITEEAAEEIERIRAERDDARREVCEWCGLFTNESPQLVATKNKWDCFREDGK